MATSSADYPLAEFPPERSSDALLGFFLDYVARTGRELYSAQEEAILELFEDRHVILNTPTGSGKSLVAEAVHYRALALGQRSIYTCPIKALVNEKFLHLCRTFGPENVGMATGDATVNREAPILCCTAEILANEALRLGAQSTVRDVIMDEFHYYSDAERGVAWQVPLLTLTKTRFLLMSATLGATAFFQQDLEKRTGKVCSIIHGSVRPVPLEFRYTLTGLDATIQELCAAGQAPVYVVHFSQNDASQTAQDLMSLNFCSQAEKATLKELLAQASFSSPYGKEMKKFLLHGIGVHHAGILPKYRVLVEKLAQQGLLKIICGTDTLGVGVNVPIRTVLLTRLTKYGGQKTKVLSARDFHQITGRAGRRGFDSIGYVVCMAPEYVIENAKLEAKAAGDEKKLRKMVKKKPPEGFVGWSEDTFLRLQTAPPEPLASSFQVSHGMLLQILSREGDGCAAMEAMLTECHETTAAKKKHRERAWQLFRSLVERQIVQILPVAQREGMRKLKLNLALQEDFSLHYTLSLWLLDALPKLDPESDAYPLDVLTLCESILENPEIILRRQLDRVKSAAMAEMKQEGIPYEERIAKLEDLEYPKPCREFVYQTFNEFSEAHPWVGQENIRPKSIAREMAEEYRSFADYVKDYDLQRVEGQLLRHLASVYKVLAQTVPVSFKNAAVQEMEDWLSGVVRGIDSSLLEEWERLRNPEYQPQPQPRNNAPVDITRNKREFTALIRTELFRFLRPLAQKAYQTAAAQLITPTGAELWNAAKLENALHSYYEHHTQILLNPEARNARHTYTTPSEDGLSWIVHQVLVDPDALNDWQVECLVSLPQAREEGRPSLQLLSIQEILPP